MLATCIWKKKSVVLMYRCTVELLRIRIRYIYVSISKHKISMVPKNGVLTTLHMFISKHKVLICTYAYHDVAVDYYQNKLILVQCWYYSMISLCYMLKNIARNISSFTTNKCRSLYRSVASIVIHICVVHTWLFPSIKIVSFNIHHLKIMHNAK